MARRTIDRSPKTPAGDRSALKATGAGTARYCKEFEAGFAADYFRHPSIGLTVSSIGIGTYLGDATDAVDAAYTDAVVHALSRGINLIDSAVNYRAQRSERSVGAALRQAIDDGIVSRDEVVVCSKGGYIPLDGQMPGDREAYREYVRREFLEPEALRMDEMVGWGHSLAPRFLKYCLAKSRQNLGVRTIDIYYVHNPGQQLGAVPWPELRTRIRGAFEALEDAVSHGDIAVYGVATWESLRVPPDSPQHLSIEDLVRVAREAAGDGHHFRVVQMPVSLAMPEAASVPTQAIDGKMVSAIEAANELGLTVVGSATLMQGRLANGLPPTVRDALPDYATDVQRSAAFARRLPGLSVALVGMKQAAHVDDTLGAGRIPAAE